MAITVEAADLRIGGRPRVGIIFFSDPPNGEIFEQFRQIERETEKRMIAVHKTCFPEDVAAKVNAATT